MAIVRPFRAIRYNQNKIGGLSRVVAPPYDVISPEEREKLYGGSPYNMVRLILGKDGAGDGDWYAGAGRLWRQWQEEGVLERDEEPAIYVYRQQFVLEGEPGARNGLIAAVRLEGLASGNVVPHEQTMRSPREDRMRVMKAVHANLSPVYSLFDDDSGEVSSLLRGLDAPVEMEVVDGQGVKNVVSVLRDRVGVEEIAERLSSKRLYIADGHHRYETALAYRELLRQEHGGGDAPYDYIMMLCVSADDPGLRILPAHRVLRGLKRDVVREFKERARRFFEIVEIENASEPAKALRILAESSDRPSFLVYGSCDGEFCLLRLRDGDAMSRLVPNMSTAWRELDVSVLHTVLIGEVLGLTPEETIRGDSIAYLREPGRVVELVASGEYQLAVFHNPTRVEQMRRVAAEGERLPPKSTYFYPKPLSGLVMNSLESF